MFSTILWDIKNEKTSADKSEEGKPNTTHKGTIKSPEKRDNEN